PTRLLPRVLRPASLTTDSNTIRYPFQGGISVSTITRRSVLKLGALGGAAAAVGLPSVAWADQTPSPATTLPTYLTGVYAPVPDEISAQNLTVDGRIPPELRGRYFRNGPNPAP